MTEAATTPGSALNVAYNRKVASAEEACRRQGPSFPWLRSHWGGGTRWPRLRSGSWGQHLGVTLGKRKERPQAGNVSGPVLGPVISGPDDWSWSRSRSFMVPIIGPDPVLNLFPVVFVEIFI